MTINSEACNALESLKFAVVSMAQLISEKGSYEKENAENAAIGIVKRMNQVIELLKEKGEQP